MAPIAVRDVWARKDLERLADPYSTTVPANDVVMLVVKGNESKATRYENASVETATSTTEKSEIFKDVSSALKLASIRIAYTNGDATPRAAELRVNGRIGTRIAFPSTGDEHTLGTVTIEARLEKPGANNVLTFSSMESRGPTIAWIEVLAGPREYDSSH